MNCSQIDMKSIFLVLFCAIVLCSASESKFWFQSTILSLFTYDFSFDLFCIVIWLWWRSRCFGIRKYWKWFRKRFSVSSFQTLPNSKIFNLNHNFILIHSHQNNELPNRAFWSESIVGELENAVYRCKFELMAKVNKFGKTNAHDHFQVMWMMYNRWLIEVLHWILPKIAKGLTTHCKVQSTKLRMVVRSNFPFLYNDWNQFVSFLISLFPLPALAFCEDLFKFLIKKGANVETLDGNGKSPL